MGNTLARFGAIAAALTCISAVQAGVVIDTVTVGNPGNAADRRYPKDGVPSFGGVGYVYNIGTFEVTAGQYTEFLNAVAGDDTFELYETRMADVSLHQGSNIQRTGSAPNYSYSVAADWANRPANYVSWGDAARFSNWLHNGQPSGAQGLTSTEDGSYYLDGATSLEALNLITRKADATWVIPTEDEWYKAAYYKGGGTDAGYWDFPTSSDVVPSNVLSSPFDLGNNATFFDDGYTIGGPFWRTEVGAHENTNSPYGTFDQGGNVSEWNETNLFDSLRRIRGGDFRGVSESLRPAHPSFCGPACDNNAVGFRVAIVPEPTTIALLAFGAVGVLGRRKR